MGPIQSAADYYSRRLSHGYRRTVFLDVLNDLQTRQSMQAANQANTQNAHSTGPRTPEGKARAAANSRTHGPCAKDVIIANPEEQIEFDELLTQHLAETRPNSSIEQVIFDQVIADNTREFFEAQLARPQCAHFSRRVLSSCSNNGSVTAPSFSARS